MSEASSRPIIFLAFANDRDDNAGYLRNLPDEARRLRDALKPAEQAGLCEVVVRANSTAEDIFKVFQDPEFRNRVAIFHFGGHANGYELLLESARGQSAAADAGGLASFLGQQQGLQLVFLNGCSTQHQTDGLLDANVSVVVSTSRAIDDQVATDFSDRFYQGLAGGATIRTAFNEAEAAVQTEKGGETRSLYFSDSKDSKADLNADRWPWDLYLRDGSESADQWNLPEAVNDPLFGLPPLPQQDLPESPFRHLNWFTRKEAEVFFGRGHQIRELFDRLTAPRTAPILLFYGQSGVGKSSILDAGLIPRLESDNDVRYLRRTEAGLLDTLGLAFFPEAAGEPLESAWQSKEAQTGRPLIVFLDQVEELFTRPVAKIPNELDDFLTVVNAIFIESEQRPQGKLVLGFRKEWLAEFESELVEYELPRTKVFLEPLDRRGIIEAVQGPTRVVATFIHGAFTGGAQFIGDDSLVYTRGGGLRIWEPAQNKLLRTFELKAGNKGSNRNSDGTQFLCWTDKEIYLYDLSQDQPTKTFEYDGVTYARFIGHKKIVAWSMDGTARLFDVAENEPIGTFKHDDEVVNANLNQDESRLLTSCYDGTVRLWDIAQQDEPLRTFKHRGEIQESDIPIYRRKIPVLVRMWKSVSAKFNADESRVLTFGSDTLKVWDVTEDKLPWTIEIDAEFTSAQFISNGSQVLTDSRDGTMRIWDPAQIEPVISFRQNFGAIHGSKLNASKTQMLTWGVHGWVWLWNLETHETVREFNSDSITSATFSADESKVLAWNNKGIAQLFDVSKEEPIGTFKHGKNIRSARINEEATHLLTWGSNTASLWDIKNDDAPLRTFHHHLRVLGAQFNTDTTQVLTSSEDGTARLWNVASETPVKTLKHDGRITNARFNGDESRVLSWGGGKAQLFDLAKDEPPKSFEHRNLNWNAKFNRSESQVLTLGSDAVRVWDTQSQESLGTFESPGDFVSAAFNRDGSQVLTWTRWDAGRLWNLGADKPLRVFKHDSADRSWNFGGARYNRDTSRILTWSNDGTARLWDPISDQPVKIFRHGNSINSAIFSPDETHLLTLGKPTAKLWNLKQSEPIMTFDLALFSEAHGGSFNRDGSRFLTFVSDGVALWDVTSDKPIRKLTHNSASIGNTGGGLFNGDETQILTLFGDELRLWDLNQDAPLRTFHHKSVNKAQFSKDSSRIPLPAGESISTRIASSSLSQSRMEKSR